MHTGYGDQRGTKRTRFGFLGSDLQGQLFLEKAMQEEVFQKAYVKLQCLKRVYPKDFRLPGEISKSRIQFDKPPLDTLKSKYEEVSRSLTETYSFQVEKTDVEIKLFNQISTHSRKQIRYSTWIGKKCIDIFIPNVRSNSKYPARVMRGLAIEVNGDVHNIENKMGKDEQKCHALDILGIGVSEINNRDLNEPTVRAIRQALSHIRPLDSRERKRLWRRIYAFTLAMNLDDEEFFRIFKTKSKPMIEAPNAL